MDYRKRPPQANQGLGTARKKNPQQEKNVQHVHAKGSSLPPTAGIITLLNNTRSCPAWQNPSSSPEDEKQFSELVLPRDKVIHRLCHDYHHPATMFGEDDNARLLRLNNLLKAGPPCTYPNPNEIRNDLPLDLVDFKRSDKNAFLRRDNKSKKKVLDGIDDGLGACNGGNVEGSEGKVPDVELDADHEYMRTHFDALCDEDKILVFFRQLLIEWERELQKRPESEKRTDKGRSNATTLECCAQNLAPLVKMCRTRMLPRDMNQALLSIVLNCLQRDYLVAMDHYIKLALNNVPCPIGITMVDIHERAEREKFFPKVVTQMSPDEIMRKCLQSVKRLMILCQRRYPIVLSKPVECNGLTNGNCLQSFLKKEGSRMGNHFSGEKMRGMFSANGSSPSNGSVL